MTNYMRTLDNKVFTPTVLKDMGLDPTDDKLLRSAGYIPIFYNYLNYDKYTEYLAVVGTPVFNPVKNMYVQDFQVLPLDAESVQEQLKQLKTEAVTSIDSFISSKITDGFDYAIDGETLHFSYDLYDQQNFVDTASACMLVKAGNRNLPMSVEWNSYIMNTDNQQSTKTLKRITLDADSFLNLYTNGALVHKATWMEQSSALKSLVNNCQTATELLQILSNNGIKLENA